MQDNGASEVPMEIVTSLIAYRIVNFQVQDQDPRHFGQNCRG